MLFSGYVYLVHILLKYVKLYKLIHSLIHSLETTKISC